MKSKSKRKFMIFISLFVVSFFSFYCSDSAEFANSVSDENSLKANSRGSTWKFIVYGDTRSRDGNHRSVLKSIKSNSPDHSFIINVGDVVNDGDSGSDWRTWQRAIDDVLGGSGQTASPPRYMSCPGNHDDTENSSGLSNWRKYLSGQRNQFGNNGLFFTFDYNNARFIILNSDRNISGSQLNMLKEACKNNPKQWLFAIWHDPIFPVGAKSYKDDIHERWGKILYENGCDIIFNGHAHYYARTKKMNLNGSEYPPVDSSRGTVQVITGNAALDASISYGKRAYMMEKSYGDLGYTELEVTGDQLRLVHISDGGNVRDEAIYTPNPKGDIQCGKNKAITTSGQNCPHEGQDMAFDGKVNTKWLTFEDSAWIQYDYSAAGGTAKVVNVYSITTANDAAAYPERNPRDWILLGSNNGSNWTTLDRRSGESFSGNFETKTYTFNNNNAYEIYRLEISSNLNPSTANSTQLSELKFFKENENENLYEAENNTSSMGCKTADDHAGYTGDGFIDYGGNGSWIEFDDVTVPDSGNYELVFRYGNGSSSLRQCKIIVNDIIMGKLDYESTGSWKNWDTDSIFVPLISGTNKIRIAAITDSGGPNADSMMVVFADSDNSTLFADQKLHANEFLESSNGLYRFYLQGDGNLVLRDYQTGEALWSSGTHGKSGSFLILQSDGNLVLYTSLNIAVWTSNTVGSNAERLNLGNEGLLKLYSGNNAVWSKTEGGNDVKGKIDGVQGYFLWEGSRVDYISKGGLTIGGKRSTPAQRGDYEIVSFGASHGSGSGKVNKYFDEVKMLGQGFQKLGVRGLEDRKAEMWIRKNNGSNEIDIPADARAFTFLVIDGDDIQINTGNAEVNSVFSSGNSYKVPASGGFGLKVLCYFSDDSAELVDFAEGRLVYQDWGFGDGDGFTVLIYGPGDEPPGTIGIKFHDGGGRQYVGILSTFYNL